jgi:ribonucleoside-diphosphate reductase alpha chain
MLKALSILKKVNVLTKMNYFNYMTREKYYWLNEDSIKFLERGYLGEGETPMERIQTIALTAQNILGIDRFADKFMEYMSRGFYSLSTPVWMNFGNKRGNPISCFNSHIGDSVEDFLIKQAEVGMMTKVGGGTSGYFGDIRPRGSKINTGGVAEGAVRCMELFDSVASIISQGSARRGSFAAYLPIDHGDFDEFMRIRSEGHSIQEMSIGVTIPDGWMQSMIDGDKEKRKRWAAVIKKRSETGYPYIFFADNANNNKPQVYKDKGYQLNASNLCSEIFLPSTKDESFVCCLSSLNLLWWDEIKKTDAIETLVMFLDAVMTEFINKTEGDRLMEAAHRFAKNHRALGMGVLGYHSYLQSKMIAWESMEAHFENIEIFSGIREAADNATKFLASKFGEPEVLKGYGRRNTTTLAIAPTTSSSFILGQVSPSIEPLNSNYFVKNLAKGNFSYRNPQLVETLEEKGKNTKEVWKDILIHGGSVQHLDFLSQKEKNVFKTFGEISQKEVVIHAAQRQKYIDQGQSLNVMIPANTKPKEINELMIFAWENGVKSLYYQRSSNPSQDLARSILTCSSCES